MLDLWITNIRQSSFNWSFVTMSPSIFGDHNSSCDILSTSHCSYNVDIISSLEVSFNLISLLYQSDRPDLVTITVWQSLASRCDIKTKTKWYITKFTKNKSRLSFKKISNSSCKRPSFWMCFSDCWSPPRFNSWPFVVFNLHQWLINCVKSRLA